MESVVKNRVNVAPSSSEGHFVEGKCNVVNLDSVTETFKVDGPSKLVTKNHTTLEMEESCLIGCQVVYNPMSKRLEKSRD